MGDGLIEIVLGILATWRLAVALYYEDGPGDAWFKLRTWAAVASPFWNAQLCCFWCCTVWAALVILPVILWLPWWVLFVPAMSGAAILLSGGGRVIWRETVDHG